jgi:hypothetical protein
MAGGTDVQVSEVAVDLFGGSIGLGSVLVGVAHHCGRGRNWRQDI